MVEASHSQDPLGIDFIGGRDDAGTAVPLSARPPQLVLVELGLSPVLNLPTTDGERRALPSQAEGVLRVQHARRRLKRQAARWAAARGDAGAKESLPLPPLFDMGVLRLMELAATGELSQRTLSLQLRALRPV